MNCLRVLICSIAAAPSSAQTLPGFTLTGENWTYNPGDGGVVITGILSKPSTNGSLPGILIGHGLGGSATGFSLPKAHEMTNWGVVCIGPNYTHSAYTNTPDNEGWCPENSRRARACLAILASLGYVDTNRFAAYGNSMGALTTAGLCGAISNQIKVAAITAGGTSGTSATNYAAPAVQEVAGITAPFLMLHGTEDTTVSPTLSATLQSILTSNSVPNDRILFSGIGHDLVSNPATKDEVLQDIHDWFAQWGLFGSTNSNASSPGRPRGIYVLDSAQGTQIGGVSMRNVTNGTPADGTRFAFETYGATYHELYVSDIDYAPYQAALTDWHNRPTALAPVLTINPTNSAQFNLAWNRAAPRTRIESVNLAGAFQTVGSVTNGFNFFAAPAASSNGFYRLKQNDSRTFAGTPFNQRL